MHCEESRKTNIDSDSRLLSLVEAAKSPIDSLEQADLEEARSRAFRYQNNESGNTNLRSLSQNVADKGMVSTRVGLMRNEVAGQSEGPIGTLKIGVKSATELEIF